MSKENISKRKRNILVAAGSVIGVGLLVGTFVLGGGTHLLNKHKAVENVNIVQVDTIDALREISVDDLKAATDTMYMVGNDYYSYFPSTGKLELVTSVHDYDTMSLTLVESMLSDVQSVSETTDVQTGLDSVVNFNEAVDNRTFYVYKELDNCNANLLLASDNTELQTYKGKLENELQQLVAYQTVSAEKLQLMLQCLGTSEADKVLAEKVSKVLDGNFARLVTEYNTYSDVLDISDIEQVLLVQKNAIEELTKKYSDVDSILTEKIASLSNIGKTDGNADIQQIINQVNNIVDSYAADYKAKVTDLNMRIEVLQELYSSFSIKGADFDSGVLVELRKQYTDLLNEQKTLSERITYLENVLDENVVVTDVVRNDNGTVMGSLKEELAEQKAKVSAITSLLENVNIDTLNGLADKYAELQNSIKDIEEILKASDEMVASEQVSARETLEQNVRELLDTLTARETDLREQLNSGIVENINSTNADLADKYATNQNAIEELRKANDNGLSSVSADLNVALQELRESVTADLTELNALIQPVLNTLSNDINAKYTDAVIQLNAIKTQISAIQAKQEEYGNRINSLESGLVSLSNRSDAVDNGISEVDTGITDLSEKVQKLEGNPYVLPVAEETVLGGVKVDGRTIDVDEIGKLHVLINADTMDSFYPIGSTYPELIGPKKRIDPYSIKVTETATLVPTYSVATSLYQSDDYVYLGESADFFAVDDGYCISNLNTVKLYKYIADHYSSSSCSSSDGNGNHIDHATAGNSDYNQSNSSSSYEQVMYLTDAQVSAYKNQDRWPKIAGGSGSTTIQNDQGGTTTVGGGSSTIVRVDSAEYLGDFYTCNIIIYAASAKRQYNNVYLNINAPTSIGDLITLLTNGESVENYKINGTNIQEGYYVKTYGYTASNPYTGSQYDSGLQYTAKSVIPRSHKFTYVNNIYNTPIYNYTYSSSKTLNSTQLNKLYAKGYITNTSNAQVYLKQLYDRFGSNVYIYCGSR